jgi:membrane protein DedA with SNARE-associated domain
MEKCGGFLLTLLESATLRRNKKGRKFVDILIGILKDLGTLLRSGQLPEWGLWSYVVLAFLVAVEGPIATLLGAAAASAGVMRPIPVFIAASVGNLTADTLWYTLGYAGKIDWFLRFWHRLGISYELLDRLQHNMLKHAAKILFFSKLSVSLVIPSLIAAGLVKARWRSWFPSVFGAEMIWTGTLVLIGYYATEAIKRVEQGLEYVVLGGSIAFVFFVLWLGRRILKEDADDESGSVSDNAR